MVLRSWERSRSNSREMQSLASPARNVIPVYTPNTPMVPKRTDPRYGTLMCPPFIPGYGPTVPVYPYRKSDSQALSTHGISSTSHNDRHLSGDINTARTSSANLAEHSTNCSTQISQKRNGFSISEILHDNDDLKLRKHRKDDGKEEDGNNSLSLLSSSSPRYQEQTNKNEDGKQLLEKCKTLDRLRRNEFQRRNIPEVMERIRDNTYFQRFVPTASFTPPSLLPPASLALQFSLHSQPGLLQPSSLYHPFHPSRSSSPPPLGVPIPVPVYLRGRTGVTPSEAARAAKKCRRSRTVFTELQLMGLEKRFEKQKYLSTPDRLELAETLGLSQLQVKTWYQNRRMKWKKQVLQGGGQEAPTKPKGRPKKSDIASMERTPSSEMEQSDDSDIESVTSPLSGDSSPQRSPMVVDKTPSPKPLMPSL